MKRSLLLAVAALTVGAFAAPAGAVPATQDIAGAVTTTAQFGPSGVTVSGTGGVTPIGRVVTRSTQTVSGNPMAPMVGDTIHSDDLVITALSNGDRLFGGYTAQITSVAPGSISFAGTMSFTGGTGQFSGATGSGVTTGGFFFTLNRGYFTVDGELAVPNGVG